jgi:hypothetical protein
MSEITLNEIDVRKLNLQPGETLVVTIKSDEITDESLYALRRGLMGYFPNNKVLVLGVGSEGSIDLTVAKSVAYDESQAQSNCGPGPANYCSDCSCGKKEAYEGNGNETT